MADDAHDQWTEGRVLDLLREWHVKPGNGGGGEYVFATHVRDAAGFSASRTFDAVSLSTWPSRGFVLHAFEVKVSRSDWLRELKEPAKAEAAARVCDKFSMVVSDPSIVKAGELPPTWGLLVVDKTGMKLRTVTAAPLLHSAEKCKEPVSRSFVIAFMRAGGATPVATSAEVDAAYQRGRREGAESHRAGNPGWQHNFEQLRDKVKVFEAASGLSVLSTYDSGPLGDAVGRLRRDEKLAERVHGNLTIARNQLTATLAAIDTALDESNQPEETTP